MFDDADDATVMVPTFGPGSFFADRYRVDSLLGSGAMGRVYAVTELHSDRKVALKILHKERLGEPETVERFRREAEVLASIGHPCIVEIYTFHHASDGTPYLAMELLEGVTLKTRLANVGRFDDPRELQEILDGICGALGAAHARGVVHRDMKPDNVFLPAVGEPRAKLVDFGLSRIAATNKGLTHSGMILGTPRYMAPEQIRDAASAGPRVDIYSVGILIFESLTGRSPYPAQDYGQLLGCVLEGRTTPFEEARPDLPRAIGDVIRRAMHPDPTARFASCDELADAYGAAIGSPSRRAALGARTSSRTPRRVASNQNNIVSSKGSTLAFDASALENLPDPYEMAPMFASQDAPTAPSAPSPAAAPHPSTSGPQPGGHTPHLAASPSSAPSPGIGATQLMSPAALTPPPMPSAHGGYASNASYGGAYGGYAQGGYASVQGHASMHGGYTSQGSQRPPPPQPYAPPPSVRPPAPAASFTPPTKGKRRGLVLFLVAMAIVIVLSAAGGFALRAYMRGELGTLGSSSDSS